MTIHRRRFIQLTSAGLAIGAASVVILFGGAVGLLAA